MEPESQFGRLVGQRTEGPTVEPLLGIGAKRDPAGVDIKVGSTKFVRLNRVAERNGLGLASEGLTTLPPLGISVVDDVTRAAVVGWSPRANTCHGSPRQRRAG